MSDNAVTMQQCPAEQDFGYYCDTLGPNEVIFPNTTGQAGRQYGVTVHRPAYQWEIVAVEAGHIRHVVFVSAVYALEQVLGLANGLGRSAAPSLN
jgi:hypothetical protein